MSGPKLGEFSSQNVLIESSFLNAIIVTPEENHILALAINLLSLRSVEVIEPYEDDSLVGATKRIGGQLSVVSDCVFVCLSVCEKIAKCARICVGDSWLNTALRSSQMSSENSAEIQQNILRKQCWSAGDYFPKTVLKYSKLFSEKRAEVQQIIFQKQCWRSPLFSENSAEVQWPACHKQRESPYFKQRAVLFCFNGFFFMCLQACLLRGI